MCFSVIITTRNRPALLACSLKSVLRQDIIEQCEVIVVVDGGNASNRLEYEKMRHTYVSNRVKFIALDETPHGHGQSHAINVGVSRSSMEYIAFLDDDDEWICDKYLSTISKIIDDSVLKVDLIYSDQIAYRDGVIADHQGWLAGLRDRVASDRAPDSTGAFHVTVKDLMLCSDFCHLNTTIIRRGLFDKINGLDETIRYECDRDFFLRSIDKSDVIKYMPAVMSRHNIPNKAKKDNMSTVVSSFDKNLYQMRVLNKALFLSSHYEIIFSAKKHLGYATKRMAEEANSLGRFRIAAYYAWQGLAINFSLKWLAYCIILSFKGRIFADLSYQ
jgi:glycosyltransferase involved in cell wall biosynthesis